MKNEVIDIKKSMQNDVNTVINEFYEDLKSQAEKLSDDVKVTMEDDMLAKHRVSDLAHAIATQVRDELQCAMNDYMLGTYKVPELAEYMLKFIHRVGVSEDDDAGSKYEYAFKVEAPDKVHEAFFAMPGDTDERYDILQDLSEASNYLTALRIILARLSLRSILPPTCLNG